jgi:hypothetical protein
MEEKIKEKTAEREREKAKEPEEEKIEPTGEQFTKNDRWWKFWQLETWLRREMVIIHGL